MGLVELSWAASALVGLPTIGFFIDRVGWNAASALLAVLGLPLAVAIARSEGHEAPSVHRQEVHRRPHLNAGIVATITVFRLMTTASQLLMIGHGLWLENTFEMGVIMGLAATLLTVFPAPRLLVGLLLLAVAFLGFEFALVSSLTLISELDPGARAKMVGWALGLSTDLRALGSITGGWLYVHEGFGTLMGATAAGCALSILMLVTLVPEPAHA